MSQLDLKTMEFSVVFWELTYVHRRLFMIKKTMFGYFCSVLCCCSTGVVQKEVYHLDFAQLRDDIERVQEGSQQFPMVLPLLLNAVRRLAHFMRKRASTSRSSKLSAELM